MTDTDNRPELTTEQQLQIRQAAVKLQREFEGWLNAPTIERFIMDSLNMMMPIASTTMWVPLLTERFARERLRALVRLEGDEIANPSVLFLCVKNAGRSQMAAGWARHLGGSGLDVFSGGSEPGSEIHDVAVQVMAEVGIDIRQSFPKPWTDEIVRAADVVITMGCGDDCPVYPGKRYLDWELPDPAEMSPDDVRPVRDELEKRIRALLEELGVEPVA